MTRAGLDATRPTARRNTAKTDSPTGQVGKVVLRTILILVVAGLVVAGATAIGNTSLGQRIPGAFFPFNLAGGRGPGGPDHVPAGVATNSNQPTGAAPQAGRGRGAPAGAASVNPTAANGAPGGAGVGQQQSLFSGRNSPSLQRGWPEEVRYVVIFAIMTTIVALALRLIRPKRRRRGVQTIASA